MVAGRYRVVGLVGRGGMGEVYRADDLKLGQPVALKFLPESLARDPGRLAHFLNEVRIARQVSHACVCRVYDIGEADGHHFISMEYVDGEDLASLLRRIGRLPQDKAIVVARQICAGLSAAHERGILHRDLKPANIMIDGRGHVRITDFGLAIADDGGSRGGDRSGTPYYMAPEQLAGHPASVQSDIYALGLILYELFTGHQAFSAGSLDELLRAREHSTPPRPSSRIQELDPGIERLILHCLESNTQDRPSSALAVAAALPGGDPLRAALEAGETPSPELVAASGHSGELAPLQAWLCFSGIVVALIAVTLLAGSSNIAAFVPLDLPPQVLEHRAVEAMQNLGFAAPSRDSSSGFSAEADYLRFIARTEHSPLRWLALRSGRPAAVSFWYRRSPQLLVPSLVGRRWPDKNDPPLTVPGMGEVTLDTRGRVTGFTVSAQQTDSGAGERPLDWAALFREADIAPDSLRSVAPTSIPPVFADTRAAWEGTLPVVSTTRTGNVDSSRPGLSFRIEAAALGGRPVHFRILYPWQREDVVAGAGRDQWAEVQRLGTSMLSLVGIGAAALVARRNLRQGRGHRSGALRLAGFVFVVRMLTWLFGAPHVLGAEEASLLLGNLAYAVFDSALLWVLYIALEPSLRRIWPRGIISWVRALDGRLLDPLVGRDVLIGTLLGVLASLASYLVRVASPSIGLESPSPDVPANLLALGGTRYLVSLLFWSPIESLQAGLLCLASLLLLRLLLRRWWAVAIAVPICIVPLIDLRTGTLPVLLLIALPFIAIALATLLRFGVVSWVVLWFSADLLASIPLTADLSAWYANGTLAVAAVLLTLAIYGLRVSLPRLVRAPTPARAPA